MRRRMLASVGGKASDLYGRSYIEALGNESANFLNGDMISIKEDTRIIARVQRLDSTTTGGALFGTNEPFYFRLIPFTPNGWRWQCKLRVLDIPSAVGSVENFECSAGVVKNLDTGVIYGSKVSLSYNNIQFVISRERPNTRVYFVEIYQGDVLEHKYGAAKIGLDVGFLDFVTGVFHGANGMGFSYGVADGGV